MSTPAFDIDRTAPVIVRDEILIAAPIADVWRLHTQIDAWTSWRSDVDRAALSGPFEPGSSFEWSTGGLDIVSTIREVVPGERTVWGGPAAGIDGVHIWTFAPENGGTRVVTEESWGGSPIEADVAGAHGMLAASIATWLSDLRAAAEG